jgi:large subunit ribosomal protein L4
VIKCEIFNFNTGSVVGTIELSEEIFGREPSLACIKRVVDWQRAKSRAGTHKTKTVSEVSGSGKKPRPQKGSGRARQGTTRAVHMRGGATVHGPLVRSHETSLPKKIRQLGLKSAVSMKLRDGSLIVTDRMSMDLVSTKKCVSTISNLIGVSSAKKILTCSHEQDQNFLFSVRNIAKFRYVPQVGLNVYDILKSDTLIISVDAVEQLQQRLS